MISKAAKIEFLHLSHSQIIDTQLRRHPAVAMTRIFGHCVYWKVFQPVIYGSELHYIDILPSPNAYFPSYECIEYRVCCTEWLLWIHWHDTLDQGVVSWTIGVASWNNDNVIYSNGDSSFWRVNRSACHWCDICTTEILHIVWSCLSVVLA